MRGICGGRVVASMAAKGRSLMNASDWWEVRRLAQAGTSQREIAVRLGINRRTVAKTGYEPRSHPPQTRRSGARSWTR